MRNVLNFKSFNEASIPRYHDIDIKKKMPIADLKIGDCIKFLESTSILRRIIPKIKDTVAGEPEQFFLKNEVFEFSNYWTDLAFGGGMSFNNTIAMEFICIESNKENRIGKKYIFSLKHYHEYKNLNKFIIQK